MRSISGFGVILFLGLLCHSESRAGLYNTAEVNPPVWPQANFQQFQETLNQLRGIGVTQPESFLRKRYLLTGFIDPRARTANFTLEQRINVSAYWIRLRRFDEAIDLLTPHAGRNANFMVLGNLATAEQLTDHYERAINYLEISLQSWPKEWPGLTEGELKRFHETEKLQLKLIRLRSAETRGRSHGRVLPPENVDNLFDVRFVGENGAYEPGRIAASEKAKLPTNAQEIVEQLLTWLPDDTRLYWLYGEILNSQGKIKEAATVLDELTWKFAFPSQELQKHRQILQEVQSRDSEQTNSVDVADPVRQGVGATSSANRSGAISVLTAVAVGAASGVLITLFTFLQVREIRRRRGGSGSG